MFLTSLMPFRRPRDRSSLRFGRRQPRCAVAAERLEARTLLSAITFRSDLATPVGVNVTEFGINVDVEVDVEELEASLLIDQPDPDVSYGIQLKAPDGTVFDLRSSDPPESGPDDGPLLIRIDQDVPVDASLDSTFGRWVFLVTVSGPGIPTTGGSGGGMNPDLGGILSGELRVTPDLTSMPEGTISGVVFDDFDGDGVQDDSEPGISFIDLDGSGDLNGSEQLIVVFVDINSDGSLTDGEPQAIPNEFGAYEITGLATPASYAVGLIAAGGTRTSPVGSDILRVTFPQDDDTDATTPLTDSSGFLAEGLPLSTSTTVETRWQLTSDRQFEANHSNDFSAVFARVLTNGTVESPDAGSQGVLLSPTIDLGTSSDPRAIDPIELQFGSFLSVSGNDVESLVDLLRVSAVFSDGSVERLTPPEFSLGSINGFTTQALDITRLVSRFPANATTRPVQFQFEIQIPADRESQVQAWYLDDIAVVRRDSPGLQIVHLNPGRRSSGNDFALSSGAESFGGTVFSDLNGDRTQNPGEPSLPGQVIALDADGDGFNGVIKTFTATLAGPSPDDGRLLLEFGDAVTGTLLGIQLQGELLLKNPDVFSLIAGTDISLTLNSPVGRFQALARVIAPPDLFDATAAPFQVSLDLLLPDDLVEILRTTPVNGTWELTAPDGGDGLAIAEILRVVLDADVESLSLRLTVATPPDDGSTADSFVVSNSRGQWEFNGPAAGEDQSSFIIVTSTLTTDDSNVVVTAERAISDSTADANSNINFAVSITDAHANVAMPRMEDPQPVELSFGPIGQPAAIDFVNDLDVFALPANTNGLVTLELETDQGSLSPLNGRLTVFSILTRDDDSTERRDVAFNDDALFFLFGEFDSRIQFNAIAERNKQYFVEVAASTAGDPGPISPRQMTGSYELFAGLAQTVVESGDVMFAADSIRQATGTLFPEQARANDPVYQVGNIDFAGDRDVYRVVLPFDGVLQIDLEDLNSGVTTELSVFANDGKLLFQGPSDRELPEPGSNLLSLPSYVRRVTTGDVLFVQAAAVTSDESTRFGNPTGQYVLSLEVVTEDDLEVTINDDPARPGGNDRTRVDGVIDFSGDIDFFDITVPGDGREFLEILLNPTDESFLDAEFSVHQRVGAFVGQKIVDSIDFENSAFRTLTIGQQVEAGMGLRIFIRGAEGSRGRYRLETRPVSEDVAPSQPPVPGDIPFSLTVMSGVDFAGDQDTFEVTIPSVSFGVFIDLDENGQVDAREPRRFSDDLEKLEQPELVYVDANSNNQIDPGEPLIFSDEIGSLDRRFMVEIMGQVFPIDDLDEPDQLYADLNNNSQFDDGEPQFSPSEINQSFTQFLDLNRNRQLDEDEPQTVSDDSGQIDEPLDPEVLAVVLVERIDSADMPVDSSEVLLNVVPGPGSGESVPKPENLSEFPDEFVFFARPGATYLTSVGFEGLVSGGFKVTVDVSDPEEADDGATIAFDSEGETIDGDLRVPGDNDIHSFTPTASGLLEVELILRGRDGRGITSSDQFDLNITAENATLTFDSTVTSRREDGPELAGGERIRRVLEADFEVVAGETYFFDVSSSSNSTANYTLELDLFADEASETDDIAIREDEPFAEARGTVSRSGSVVSRLITAEDVGGRLTIDLFAGRGLIPEINVFNADENGNATGTPIATKRGLRRNDRLDVQVPLSAQQDLVVTVGAARPSDGDFELLLQLAPAFADDVPNNPSQTQGDNGSEFDDDINFERADGTLRSVTRQRRINFDADVDVFELIAPFTGRIGVAMTATGSGNLLDPELSVIELIESAGNERGDLDFDRFLQFDDNSGRGLNSALDFRVIKGRTYFVEAGAANAESGAYTITFSPISGDDFGDTLSSADSLILNDSGVISRDRNSDGDVDDISESNRSLFGILTGDDTDVFRFTSTVTRQLSISALGVTGNLTTDVFVYEDLDGVRRLIRNGSTDVIIDAVEGREYLLQLDSQGMRSGLYRLDIDPIDVTRRLRLDTQDDIIRGTDTAQGRINRAGRAEFYEFTAPFAGRVVVELTGTSDDLNPIVSVQDSNRVQFAANDNLSVDSQNSRLEFNVNTRETFLLRVAGVGNSTGNYELDVTVFQDSDIGDDPGEIIRDGLGLTFNSDPRPLATQLIELAPVTTPGGTDTDVFSFLAETSGRVRVNVSQIESAAALAGSEFTIAELSALREASTGADLLVATGSDGDLLFEVIRGETYAIRVTGRGSFGLRAAVTPTTNNSTRPFLNDSVGNATTELLGQIFTQLVSSGQDFSAEDLSQAVLDEFFAASGGQENLQERFLLLYVDPVDFVLESSTGDQAGFTADRGQLDQYGNTFYSGDAVTELLVIPQADAGRYTLQLEGLGQDVRGGVSLVSNAGTITTTFERPNLTGRTVVDLNFPESELPGQTFGVADIEPVPVFPVSVILTSLLGIAEPDAPPRRPGTNFRDVFVNFLPPYELFRVLPQLPQILSDLSDDLRVFVPMDFPDWNFNLSSDPTDAEPDWLLPTVAPGMSGLLDAMSRFGELVGELLLPVVEIGEQAEEEPANELPEEADPSAAAVRRRRPPVVPAEDIPSPPEPAASEPVEKTSQASPSHDPETATVAQHTSTRDVWSRNPGEPKRTADVWS